MSSRVSPTTSPNENARMRLGLTMFGFSDYVGAGSEVAGWSESCRYVITAGGNARHHGTAAIVGRNGGVTGLRQDGRKIWLRKQRYSDAVRRLVESVRCVPARKMNATAGVFV